MKPLAFVFFMVGFGSAALGQTFSSYHSTADLSLASPGALRVGLYGFDNPAMLTYLHQPDVEFILSDAGGTWSDLNRWGLFAAVPNFGFGLVKTKVGPVSVNDYRLALSFGNRDLGIGLGYGFSGGDRSALDRRNVVTLGALLRPDQYVSVGLVGNATTSGGRTEVALDLGIRPLGDEMITLFADYALQNTQTLKQGSWSYGAVVEALPGIRLTGRVFNTHAFAIGLSLSFGNANIAAHSTWDRNSRHAFNTYSIRLGAYDRTVLTRLMKRSKYLEMNLNGAMKYQRFVLFDNANTLRNTLDAITAAQADETVAGIAINTSGMQINREMLWEMREKLKEFKASGKRVVVFVDRPSLEDYRFATVADKIVLDPTGIITLPGYIVGSTFLKGTLEKLGIGFDEWRFFTYKSAYEPFSRDHMSDADREQKQKFVNDLYAGARQDICDGRGFSPDRFDRMVDDEVLYLPQEARAKGLVDTLGRWEEVKDMVKKLEGENKRMIGAGSLAQFNLPPDHRWGERPRIAVIYALGVCAMDEGIKARSLVKDVEAAAEDPGIRAIVLRVDSPGGDGMASDYIAEALKKARKKKPVIVSQGYVAGSGGYWLSMYADTIVAAPNTITGSIGVIGGWMYNKEAKEKLGMSTDRVQAGKHADLGFGFRLPFLGVGLPDRNLTAEERAVIERSIRSFYQLFVEKVAEGRRTSADNIEPLAQGRFYSGTEGKQIGLVDVLGGMDDALRIARQKAGIKDEEEVRIIELPRPRLIDWSGLLPSPLATTQPSAADGFVQHLKFLLDHNGQPLPLMPLDVLDFDVPTE